MWQNNVAILSQLSIAIFIDDYYLSWNVQLVS